MSIHKFRLLTLILAQPTDRPKTFIFQIDIRQTKNHELFILFGSNTSRKPSPNILNESIVINIARDGKTIKCG